MGMNHTREEHRDELVQKNMGYVVTLARQYTSELLSTDDLIRGNPFVTFAAPYIRHGIEEAIRKASIEK